MAVEELQQTAQAIVAEEMWLVTGWGVRDRVRNLARRSRAAA